MWLLLDVALSEYLHGMAVLLFWLADTILLRNGAVAQLGERRVRNAKVGSSILLRSTTQIK